MNVALFDTDGVCKIILKIQPEYLEANLAHYPDLPHMRDISGMSYHLPQAVPNLSEFD